MALSDRRDNTSTRRSVVSRVYQSAIASVMVTICVYASAGIAEEVVLDQKTVTQTQSLTDRLDTDSNLSVFVNALKRAGIWQYLDKAGHVTLFIPTNAAMDAEGSRFLLDNVLLTDENRTRLVQLLSLHIVEDSVILGQDTSGIRELSTLAESCLNIQQSADSVKVGIDAHVNGMLHLRNATVYFIDRLLWQAYDDTRICKASLYGILSSSTDVVMSKKH